MISFIIIAKNEAITLKKCFDSIFNTIKNNRFSQYEVLYVDSNSRDNSIEIAKQYNAIKILRLTGYCSPAIARNIGAKEAKGSIFFFIDGDSSINPAFIDLNKLLKQSEAYVYGPFSDITSHCNKNIDNKTIYTKEKSLFTPFHGGIFIIARKLFDLVNGFKEKYRKAAGEDIDLSLRLLTKGYAAKYKNKIIAYHYTVDYLSFQRAWQMLWNGSQLYARSVLYRDHLFNKKLWPLFLRREYGLMALLISLVVCVLMNSFLPLLLYAATTLFRILFQRNKKWFDIPNRLLYYPTRDVYVFLGMLFFFPRKPKNIKYEIIK